MKVRRHPASTAQRGRDSLVALATVAVVSAAGLLATGLPLPSTALTALVAPDTVLTLDTEAEAEVGTDAAKGGADGESEADTSLRKALKHPRRSRQSLAIPYFSFARG